MQTHTIEIPELLQQYIDERIASGDYGDTESVIVASLLRDKAEADAEAVKTERFWTKIQSAIDELDRGEGIVVDDLEAFFDDIMAEVEADFAAKAA